jgi:hypothetical protein
MSCKNCIRLAGPNSYGLDNDKLDLDMEDVRRIVDDIYVVASKIPLRPLIGFVALTGGEPLLHPKVGQIFQLLKKELHDTGLTKDILINTNGLLPPPVNLKQWCVTYSTPQQKHDGHLAMFADKHGSHFDACTHYRKWRVVVSRLGWSLCCAAEGYARLAQKGNHWLKNLPINSYDFPTKTFGGICAHCAFSAEGRGAPLEKDSPPVSQYFQNQIDALKQR